MTFLNLSFATLNLSQLDLSYLDFSRLDLSITGPDLLDLICPDLISPDLTCPNLAFPASTCPDLTRSDQGYKFFHWFLYPSLLIFRWNYVYFIILEWVNNYGTFLLQICFKMLQKFQKISICCLIFVWFSLYPSLFYQKCSLIWPMKGNVFNKIYFA